ncbi:hypothetical protein FQN49_006313 [Arthroderma sp. PD_2]|nr:hypothetical protein FQN49_006313 [Arthroderma sp. PD_2]
MSPKQASKKIDEHPSSPIRESDVPISTQTQKPFTTLSAIGIGYGVTNTAVGIPLILITAIPLGGSPLVFWGFLAMAVVGLATAMTLAELISAIPHPGGQYIWVNKLAPQRYRRGLSYTTAMISWIAAIATGSSGNLSVPLNAFTIVTLLHPNFIYQRWMGFVVFQVINIITCFGACFENVLPKLSKALLLLNAVSVGVIITTLFAMSSTHTSAEDFFKVVNISGWPDGVAFIIGLNGLNWCFSCLDVATHLAEEIPSPGTNIPKALIWTIVIATSSGLLMVLAILLNLGPIDTTDYSGIALFYRITGSKFAAIGLWIPVLFLVFASVWSIQTWQSRLAWTISRESGFPLHRHFSKIFPAPFYTPIWSLVGSAVGTALFGCLYLASELAFNSLIATGILLQYTSYSIPTILVIWQGRSNFRHGQFWYPKLGFLANIIMLAWTVVAFIFYCFPAYSEVLASQMNYVSGVLVSIAIFIASLWFLYAKKNYNVLEI